MRSQIQSRPVFQRILYSQAWEDPQADLDGLRLGPGDDVLAVGASGDNALCFVTAGPRSVTALDFNPTQNHLLELKLSAIESFEPEDVQAFLGARPARPGAREFFYRQARPLLSPAAREFWDAHPDLLDRGVIHVGRFEGYLGLFRRYLVPLAHSLRTRRRLMELETLEEQREFYRTTWDNRRWRLLFRAFFGKTVMGRLGRDPEFFRYVDVGQVGERFRRRFEHAVTGMPVRDNWFLEYMTLGEYTRPDHRLPPYLRPEHHALLRARGRETLRLVTGSFEEFLPTQPEGAFSAFYLSDIFEWMSQDAFHALLRQFHRAARDGARLTWRNLLVPRGHPDALSDLFEHEPALSQEIHARDRSFVYGAFVVERVKKAARGLATA
ncbi:MAG: BtaA family protein [Planctomycetes bacterium]|nr:BtaA family protein [Planctomycetota bacterium]MCW8141133.1 BtaA family protein [Planctomycetota bacterium]